MSDSCSAHHLGVRPDGLLDLLGVGGLDEADLDLVPLHDHAPEEPVRPAVHVVTGHHVVAGPVECRVVFGGF